jgi:hypothetical protein
MTAYTGIFLGNIFSRTKNREKFTNDALLYQEILSFSLQGINHQPFTFIGRDISKWLKKNHQRLEKRSVDSLTQLVDRKIKKLMELQLIHEIGTQPIKTGTGQTSVYAFDSMGYFLGWLTESLSSDPVIKNKTINKLFNILYFILETDMPSSMTLFLKLLVRKIKDNNLFMHLVDFIFELLVSGNYVKDISDLINQTLLFRHVELNLVKKYNELWGETLNELEPKTRQLVIFRTKLLYEQRMKERALDLAQFERERFAGRKMFDKLVVECDCLSCFRITYETFDLIEYTTKLRYHIEGRPVLEKEFSSCSKTGSLQITDL